MTRDARTTRPRRAFTILEMLVVVTMLALLAGLSLSSLARTSDRAIKERAATGLVTRLLTVRGRLVTASELQAADVNSDGVVSSQDVMAVIRGIHLNDRPARDELRPTPPSDADPGGNDDENEESGGA